MTNPKKFSATVTITLRLSGEAADPEAVVEELRSIVGARLLAGYKTTHAFRHGKSSLAREFGGARAVFHFDDDKHSRYKTRLFAAVKDGELRKCRQCGCTDRRACAGGCSWAKKYSDNTGLCSTCAAKKEAKK